MLPTTARLPPGIQDLLGFVYQFALQSPFSGTVHFHMTNGKKLDTYAYQVMGDEMLDTAQGSLRTLHLSKVRQPNEEWVDIWLATDHQYLPVKIRLTGKEGSVAEQVVSAIRIE